MFHAVDRTSLQKIIRPAARSFKEYPNAEIRRAESRQWWTELNRQPL
jgi:hypothetical protein